VVLLVLVVASCEKVLGGVAVAGVVCGVWCVVCGVWKNKKKTKGIKRRGSWSKVSMEGIEPSISSV
jgi:seryl-tRNA(Sec) selenium transferase